MHHYDIAAKFLNVLDYRYSAYQRKSRSTASMSPPVKR